MKKKLNADIIILGGGASGLLAAISAAYELKKLNKPYKITILEKSSRVGKKILMTGNGKCNLTNKNISINNYNLSSHSFIDPILKQYPYEFVVDFFKNLGLITRTDSTGRVYPYSNQASSVLDILLNEINRLNINVICDFEPIVISKNKNKFYIESIDLILESCALIISCGGKASPAAALSTDAYKFFKNFGHSVTPLYPSLVPIKTNSGFEKSLKGIRTPGTVKLIANNKVITTEKGEIQFTDTGLSGICIFQISSLVAEFVNFKTVNNIPTNSICISLDLMPEYSESDITNFFIKKINHSPKSSLENLFTGILNKSLGQVILKKSFIKNFLQPLSSLSKKQLTIIAYNVKNFTFVPIGVLPFKNAQVTYGGISLNEFYNVSLESRKIKNLFACGEILDVNGDCGGFNLHWAWVSGYIAGKAAADSFDKK